MLCEYCTREWIFSATFKRQDSCFRFRFGYQRIWHLCIFTVLFFLTSANAATFDGTPDNYRKLLKQLKAGDTLELQPGSYNWGLPIHWMVGEVGKPIVITGKKGLQRPLFIARSGHNTISIVNSAHIHLKDLELDGLGLPVDGVKAEGHSHWAHHIVLENLLIRGHGNNQQTVGISTKCPAWSWTIRNSVIVGAGTGIYLGDSNGGKPFIDGLIEHNLIIDSTGYNLQIKHQLAQPAIPGLPPGGKSTIIRHNVFSKSKASTEEGMARPNVLLGHWPLHGPGEGDIYQVYGNLFYDNPSEALFQGEGNIGLYSNLFVNPHGDAVNIQPHNDVPRRVDIFSNTVVAAGAGITIRRRENDNRFTPRVTANAVFASPALVGGVQRANLSRLYEVAGEYLVSPYGDLNLLNLFPKIDISVDAIPDFSQIARYLDWNRDFNGNVRNERYLGAYRGEGENLGWHLRMERKP